MKGLKRLQDRKWKEIQDFLGVFQYMFGIQNFDHEIIKEKEDYNDRMAFVTTEHDYQRVTIRIYPLFFTKTKKEQRKALIHELCHTLIVQSKRDAYALLDGKLVTHDAIDDHNEEATSKIENIIDGLLQGRFTQEVKTYKKFL